MPADLTTYLPLILIALVVLAIAVWAFLRANRTARVVDEDGPAKIGRDVLEEGAEPARRNQALIDSPRGIEIIQGDLSAMANAQVTATASMDADAESGAPITPTGTAPAPAPIPEPGTGDDLTRIKGLGPKLATLLGQFGINRYAQIAAWTPDEIERIDAQLGRFAGRITRDQWVEQAKLLAAGDETGFAARYGNNG